MPPISSIPLYQWYSLYMASVEITLGSILHGARIPLTGYILSLHQVFCLSRAMRHEAEKFTPICVSTTVAILKTLSPAGKKLTPMIAIMAQGFLFNMGILCCGNNTIGHMLGSILLSFWGFAQPILFALLIFRQDLWSGLSILESQINTYIPGGSLLIIAGAIILFKAFLAMGCVIAANSCPKVEPWLQKKLSFYQRAYPYKNKPRSLFSALTKDLTSFWFLFSLTTVAVFSWYRDDPLGQVFLIITGYLAQGILLMMALRLVNPKKIITYLEKKGLYRLSSNLRAAYISIIQKEQ